MTITVYQYEVPKGDRDDAWKQARRYATLDAITRLGGRPLLETARQVDVEEVDIDGLHRPELPRRDPAI